LTSHPNLLVGMERVEDAGVYKISDEIAIVQTVDFFTPIVDDPYTFGQIAAANALSDVYAIGGKPITAMNVVCFPVQSMDISVLREVLLGGIEKIREADAVLLGGHSVDDAEIKYGLSVTGTINPVKIMRKENSKAGDRLVLTKPIGTGIISTAIKGEMASENASKAIIESMAALNRKASEVMLEVGVNACTDITGFGLLGHASEMIENTDKGIEIYAGSVPIFKETYELAEMGMIPAGLYRNREHRKSFIDFEENIDEITMDILFDPQTSGGLLISVPEKRCDILIRKMHDSGVAAAAIIGEVNANNPGRIRIMK
jgi:selenide, water dikinase